jgi:ubiquinone/menaquinone biosynthesis C-methylase UbiE
VSIIEKSLKLDINRIVFIGRTFEEYIKMFDLSPENLENMKVLDCAGGACSFTAHANKLGIDSTSCDIAYYHEVVDLEQKGLEDIEHTIEHMEKASGNYVWEYFSSIDALKEERSRALKECVQDMRENPQHYQAVTLPVLPFENKQFDMTVCAHLLFMYSDRLDYQFHLNSLKELIRVTKGEIRIFPLTDLYGKKYDQLSQLMNDLKEHVRSIEEVKVSYEFQKNANHMLVIKLK